MLFVPTIISTKHFHRFPSGGSTRWFLGWRSQVSRTTGRRLGINHSSFVDTYSPLQFILDFLALPIMHKYNRGKWNVKKLNMNKNTNIIFSPGNVVLTETCYFRYHHFHFQQLDLQLKGWLAIAKLKPLSHFISLLSLPKKAFDTVKIEK